MTLTYYLQSCPTCGRRLQVRIEYLGKQVICYHCHGSFVALDPDLNESPVDGQKPTASWEITPSKRTMHHSTT